MDENKMIETIKDHTVSLDDTFRFHCTQCGKCCIYREDILLPPRDLYKIAKELNMTVPDAFHQYCETYIGSNSRIPIVRLKPRGSVRRCPLLKDRKCMVHKAKPGVCAMYPLGRYLAIDPATRESVKTEDLQIKYLLQPITCGDKSEVHTVRDWLADFDIKSEDQIFLQWHAFVQLAGAVFARMEKILSPEEMQPIWDIFFCQMYMKYDTKKEFLPQFTSNICSMKELLQQLSSLEVEENAG